MIERVSMLGLDTRHNLDVVRWWQVERKGRERGRAMVTWPGFAWIYAPRFGNDDASSQTDGCALCGARGSKQYINDQGID